MKEKKLIASRKQLCPVRLATRIILRLKQGSLSKRKDIRQQLGACKGGQRPFDEIYCQCDQASQELAALAIMLTGDSNMFGYELPPSGATLRS